MDIFSIPKSLDWMLLILGLVASTWPYLRCDVGLEEVEY